VFVLLPLVILGQGTLAKLSPRSRS
jgi:hypothetical protein